MRDMEKSRVIHRDIKNANIFLSIPIENLPFNTNPIENNLTI